MKLKLILSDKGKTSFMTKMVLNKKYKGIISLSDKDKNYYSATIIDSGDSKVIYDKEYSKKNKEGYGVDLKAFSWANNYLISLIDNDEDEIYLDGIRGDEIYKKGYFKFLQYAKKKYKKKLILTLNENLESFIINLLEPESVEILRINYDK